MKIVTRDFGEIEINENTIIDMPNGILGFEETTRYTLLSPLGEDVFPMWLQAVDSAEPCFVVYDPLQIYPDYKFEIDDDTQKELRVNEQNIRCLAVAIVPDDYRQTTINLRCPIVLNTVENIAGQVLLLEDYDFKYPVYSEEV